MTLFPKPYADAVARLRVPSGFLIVIVFAWFSRPTRLPDAVEVRFAVGPARRAIRLAGQRHDPDRNYRRHGGSSN